MGGPGNQAHYPGIAKYHAEAVQYRASQLSYELCLTLTAAVQTPRGAHITYMSSNSAWGYSNGSNGRFISLSLSAPHWMTRISPLGHPFTVNE